MNFKELRIKNFRSYGNNITTFKLDNNKINLVIGKNGGGKSSVFYALYFALTGKAFSGVNKDTLINQHNKKDCLVELDFEHYLNNYTVRRGIKPNLFEILKNGEKLDETSHVNDYQHILESIIGITPSAIKQTTIMSADYYVPFLKMTAPNKRDFLENILSLKLLSVMNDLLKVDISSHKEQEVIVNKDIERIESNISLMEQVKFDSDHDSDVIVHKANKSIHRCTRAITRISNIKKVVFEKQETLTNKIKEFMVVEKKLAELKSNEIKVASAISSIEAKIEHYKNMDVCKECGQDYPKNMKDTLIIEARLGLDKLVESQEGNNITLIKVQAVIEKRDKLLAALEKYKDKINKANLISTKLQTMISNNKKLVLSHSMEQVDNTQKILNMKMLLTETTNKLFGLTEKKINIQTVSKLISDKGIKKFVMNKYIPVINKHVNQYLEIMDAEYRLVFDNEMEATILSRGYENLTYDNLSAGEKQRCDLSMLFTFLDIARFKSNVTSKLVIFDEMFQSLDVEGIRGLNQILNALTSNGYTIFIIDHNKDIIDIGDVVIKTAKKNKFSVIESI